MAQLGRVARARKYSTGPCLSAAEMLGAYRQYPWITIASPTATPPPRSVRLATPSGRFGNSTASSPRPSSPSSSYGRSATAWSRRASAGRRSIGASAELTPPSSGRSPASSGPTRCIRGRRRARALCGVVTSTWARCPYSATERSSTSSSSLSGEGLAASWFLRPLMLRGGQHTEAGARKILRARRACSPRVDLIHWARVSMETRVKAAARG